MAGLDKDWVQIYANSFLPKLEMLKSKLEESNIPTILFNQQDSSYGFGEAALFVKSENVIKAKHLIKEEE